ncbi:multidrug ABC transporter substrate-binding protein [Ktedonobacter sp. SOSP1-85]|uniref:ABC transporter permease n=1 Tax=Ktedonobacter sp. SOSP1-85 TaxID=2778367 RepID=UPI001916420A|nr:ABC transporter permease [Ktedonobacter sp. SOSP1-85]GHO81670.1 multidrug ABC transporter substrate-binding protein [Ktedonobacter sp. SOSP1-85]
MNTPEEQQEIMLEDQDTIKMPAFDPPEEFAFADQETAKITPPLATSPLERKGPGEGRLRRRRGTLALYQSFSSAVVALRANKMRSLLTSLGIIIGVGAVIVMVSVSQSNAAVINQRLSTLNPNELVIRSGSANSSGVRQGQGSLQTLTQADADALSSRVPNVSAVSPIANASGQVIFQGQNWASTIQGVYPSFQTINSWQMQEGNFISDTDEQSGGAVAVIGQTVADNLFTPQGVDPLGQQIRIRNVPFTVVGVLASKGASAGQQDADDVVYVPFSTAQRRLTGSQFASSIDVLVSDQSHMTDAQSAVQQVLEQQHHIGDPASDDFVIQNQAQVLDTVQTTTQALTFLLVSVAAISLLVGGIGIMNIMLVSVTERTREIGIRMAIGARPRDVMTQFLIEALMLSALGGLVGILIGIGGGFIVSLVANTPFVLSPLAVLLAFGFSAGVGVVFGFYPAQRAAQLDPIVALRTE